ncbi:MAG TPA: type II CAAX endopeptidase family protein [Propionicimonas sp.]|nr:type II CAAX endopeptidase family protein [Propionicimonas sp.]HRA05078.1 type II CAAX endopeptidase family protein [Propionicimonas sp.]
MPELAGFVAHEPKPGVTYPEVLVVDERGEAPLRRIALGLGGPLLGLITFLTLTPLVTAGLIWLGWVLAGSPGDWLGFYRSAAKFELPAGVFATHLGLALLIPISFGLVLLVHRFSPRWLHSVQPGFRWRYALAATLVAIVVLVGLWVLSRIGQPWVFAPEQDIWWFLVAIVLTSPLQAAAEEYFFRGYLLQAIHTAAPAGPWFGVIGSAAVFALLHGTQDVPLFLHRFVFGLIAGALAVLTGGLEAGIAAHVVNNLVAFGYGALSGTLAQTKGVTSVGWAEAAWNLVGFAMFAVGAVWLGRKMNLATTTPGVRAPSV